MHPHGRHFCCAKVVMRVSQVNTRNALDDALTIVGCWPGKRTVAAAATNSVFVQPFKRIVSAISSPLEPSAEPLEIMAG